MSDGSLGSSKSGHEKEPNTRQAEKPKNNRQKTKANDESKGNTIEMWMMTAYDFKRIIPLEFLNVAGKNTVDGIECRHYRRPSNRGI